MTCSWCGEKCDTESAFSQKLFKRNQYNKLRKTVSSQLNLETSLSKYKNIYVAEELGTILRL